jgi:hypothetical protein
MKHIFISLLLLFVFTYPTQCAERRAHSSIVRLDPAFDQLVPKDATLEKLTGGYTWTEGPVGQKHGYLCSRISRTTPS